MADTSKLKKFTHYAGKLGDSLVTAPSSEAAGLAERRKNIDDYMGLYGTSAEQPEEVHTPFYVAPKPDPSTQYGTRPGEQRLSDEELKQMMKPLGSH